jgi:tRNA G18 (ribose-2'-O)-methylase SpoU
MGNESSGLRPELEITLDKKFKIPKYINSVTESLNVSVAAGILMDKITSR